MIGIPLELLCGAVVPNRIAKAAMTGRLAGARTSVSLLRASKNVGGAMIMEINHVGRQTPYSVVVE
jgi:2,4-dienoyl-CoA reductase-like NADH-dependent reductase (Old Yellow Enzyme family)